MPPPVHTARGEALVQCVWKIKKAFCPNHTNIWTPFIAVEAFPHQEKGALFHLRPIDMVRGKQGCHALSTEPAGDLA